MVESAVTDLQLRSFVVTQSASLEHSSEPLPSSDLQVLLFVQII